MAQNSLEQLRQLSEIIEKEEMSLLLDRMMKAQMNEDGSHTEEMDPRKITEREKCAFMLLRSMRIHLCIDLIRQGHSACMENFRKDWDEIIDCLRFMECTWEKVSNELLSDAVDIVLLLDPGKRNDLLRLLGFSTRLRIKKQKPLGFHVMDCAFQMAEYCLRTGRAHELFRMIANLISLSEERNGGHSDIHRAIVAQGLYDIVDNDWELTLQICEAHRRYFEGISGISAGYFYWFYAVDLWRLGRRNEAAPLLRYCHDLWMEAEGERSWMGVQAGSLYHYQMLFSDSRAEAEAYLWDSLKKIDSGFYHNMDGRAAVVAASTRSILLKLYHDQQKLRGLLPEIERFRDYCVSVQDTNLDPNLTVRHAENTLAEYYLESGDYLQAADHALQALHAVPANNVPAIPSDILIYSNLLVIYNTLNDADKIFYYAQKLSELSDGYEDDLYARSRIEVLMNTAAKKIDLQTDDPEGDRQILLDFYHGIRGGEIEHSQSDLANVNFAQWILDKCAGILDAGTADHDELLRFRKIAAYFPDRPDIYKFNDPQKCICYGVQAQIEWQLDSPEALVYLDKCLQYIGALPEFSEGRISLLRFAAVGYYDYHRRDRSLSLVNEVLSCITAAWQKATAYLNDHRVCQLLSFIQSHFGICYAILRATVSPDLLYERVLRFKDLPALVGRERNRLLRLAPVDERLKARIFEKQDQLAAAELNDALNGTNSAQAISAQLEHLEAQFAAQFPQNLYFTEITGERVREKLPDGSAIVEYYFALNEKALCGSVYESDAWELDIFITTKRNGVPRLDYIRTERGDIILEQAEAFIDILQDPANVSASGEKAALRADLYRKLIAPVLPLLEGISDLYIAPDDQLCNLPFEILYAEGSGLLQDRFKVCRLVSGRDLLFRDDHGPTGGGCFILGDPNYESQRGEISHSHTRGARMSLEPMDALPFSNIEAVRIGQRCRCGIYTGDAATKYALQEALPCSVIHLATHGVFDENLETDSLYSSHLVFAGYNRWVSDKTESTHCGNGVLTADEISRMDLQKTELAVLSVCQSGMGDTSYGSVRGLLSAFSAAGARWVVSHMWEADDFSTPILMDAFYDAWLNKGRDVPDALRYAKNYLRTATIGTLRRNGWLSLPDDARISEDTLAEINDMNSCEDEIRPFEDEYYWGGFTVHKTK